MKAEAKEFLLSINNWLIAGSSNGRTTAFEAVYHGPNPCPAAAKSGFAASRQADLSESRDDEVILRDITIFSFFVARKND